MFVREPIFVRWSCTNISIILFTYGIRKLDLNLENVNIQLMALELVFHKSVSCKWLTNHACLACIGL